MKNILNTICCICLLTAFSLATTAATNNTITIKGIVKDADQNTPLSYVNIGIINTTVGTITAPDGTFELYIDSIHLAGTIRVSHIGYIEKEIQLEKHANQQYFEISLTIENTTLEQIEVRATQLFSQQKGCKETNTKRNVNFSISQNPNQNLGAAIAKKFKNKKKKIYIDTVHFFIRQNNFDTVRFRVAIHEIDNKRPGRLINREDIITEINHKKQGWINLDLTAHNIVCNQNFIVSIEWVYHSKKGNRLRMPINLPSIGSTHYYRYGSQNEWKKFGGMSSAIYLSMKTE